MEVFFFIFQLEWVTAGDCIAGLHEVVVTNKTIEAIKAAKQSKPLESIINGECVHRPIANQLHFDF